MRERVFPHKGVVPSGFYCAAEPWDKLPGKSDVGWGVEVVGQMQKHMADSCTEPAPARIHQQHKVLKKSMYVHTT